MRSGVYLRLSKLHRLYAARNRIRRGPPGLIPLLDLVLILFVFYMAHAPFVLQPGITMTLPSSPFRDGVQFGRLLVTVTRDGVIFFNDDRVSLQELPARFRNAADDESLIIQADGFVSHHMLVQIYNMASDAGIREVVLAAREPGVKGGVPR
ncbi:MAG TPA: biopolymer transporter ExbD [Kiritimatiellia bacterium]|nr:biopolymer transporter ExbD [Kiritimatiellia bacterium]HNR94260.1 biopolymer transporter ExbD [Kiritimatiellia bacterium]HNS80188.1 biopolymer transporter ExbD [Kiritimatiellia bacterium]HPA77368.1 biopolymer transporter ExbD [Kiritimatiellia bacterium]HQQ03884.1 biopolymer transporter ExbD [Kiritimatiellia bacterium]